MKRLFVFVLFFSVFAQLSAQGRYTITGTMVDSLNNEKVMFVTIGLMKTDSTAQTVAHSLSDAQGIFQMSNVPAGEYRFVATLVGYEMLNMPFTVGGDSKTIDMGSVYMKKTSTDLDVVQIVGEKPVYMIDGEKTLYNVAEDPTIQSGTAADALQNAPGVEVDVDGNVTLRGVSSVEIWINNKPSNMNAEALKQFIQQMPAGSIEKIEVITNPSARYSAQGSGGIINIVTTSKIKKNSFLSFGLRGSSTPSITPFISYVYANDKFSISTYLNYSYGTDKNN
ncbi:MAG: carboxypeptidase-like regulatory domain-containing protein, partial [Bacteroidales bacterium]|nr:carboxypeptidase-like regulatory domain-containing protein [Bacteroidales bacterium]